MFGTRRRPAPLDQLELERAATKVPKEDALSIYEATLQKLKHGSLRAFATPVECMKHNTLPPEGTAVSTGDDSLSTDNADQPNNS